MTAPQKTAPRLGRKAVRNVLVKMISAPALYVAAVMVPQPAVQAASGTWITPSSGGLWGTNSNWLGGTVADGSGFSANFSTLDITGNLTVSLDSARTLTSLSFGDTNTTTAAGWVIDNNGNASNTLTLAGTTPTITVNALGTGRSVTLSTVIAGTAGLTKAGAGTLVLNGVAVNTLTGGLNISGGTLGLDFANLVTPTNLLNSGNALTLSGGGSLSVTGQTGGGVATSQTLGNLSVSSGGGSILIDPNNSSSVTLVLGNLTATAAGSSLLVGKAVSANTGAVTITTTTNKDTQGIYGGRTIFANGTANTGYDFATTASGGSPYTLAAFSGYTSLVGNATTDTLNAKVTGNLSLAGANSHNSLKIEDPAASQALALGANLLTLNSGGLLVTGTNAFTISGTAGATRLMAGNGSGAYDLIVHQYNSGGLTISAVIGNNGANATALTKSGPGTLTLTGVNTYTGVTTVSAGTLALDLSARIGSYSLNSNSVAAGGTLELFNTNTGVDNTLLQNTSISGAGILNKTGAGYLTLHTGSSIAGFSGTINVSTGTLAVNNVGAGASTAGATINIAGGATFDQRYNSTLVIDKLTGSGTLNHSFTDAVTLTVGAGNGTSTFDGVISSTGGSTLLSLAKNGSGSFTLAGANTFSGTTTVSAGTLRLANSLALQNSIFSGGAGTLVFDSSVATHGFNFGSLNASTNLALADNGSNAVTLTIGNNTTAATYSGQLSGAGSLIKTGAGTQTLSGTNIYTGATTISAGTLSVSTSANLGNSASNLIFDGGTLQITGTGLTNFSTIGHTVSFNAAKTVGVDINATANTFTVDQVLNQTSGGFTKLGTGTVVLNQTNTYTGATTISAGTLQIGGSGSLNSGNYSAAISIATASVLQYSSSAAQTVSGAVSGAGSLLKDGAGTLTLSSTSYSGATTVGNGTLKLLNTGGFASATSVTGGNLIIAANAANINLASAAGTVSLAGGTLTLSNETNHYLVLSGAVTANNAAGSTIFYQSAGGVSNSGIYLDGGLKGTNRTVTIDVTGAQAGSGVVFRTANTTFTGSIIVTGNGNGSTTEAGIAILAGTPVLSGADITLNSARLETQQIAGDISWASAGGNATIGALSGNANAIAHGVNTLTVGATGNSGNFAGVISGTQAFTKTGNGTQTLSGANTFTGLTTVTAGTLTLANSLALQNSIFAGGAGALVFDSGVGTHAFTVGGLNASTNLVLADNSANAVALSVGNNTTAVTYSGGLSGAGSLIKIGSGTQTFAGTNTYSGTTTVSAGTLKFAKTTALYNGVTASWTAANVTAASGATLALNVGGPGGEFAAADINTLLGNISVASSPSTGLQVGANVGFDTTNAAGGSFTQGNVIADSTGAYGGAIGLTKLGTGTLVLDKVNTYSGTTTISGGTLNLALSNALPGGATVRFGNTSTLQFSGNPTLNLAVADGATGTVNGSGTLTQAAVDFKIGGSGAGNQVLDLSGVANFVYNAPTRTLQVGPSVTVSGGTKSGTLTLSPASTITAATINVGGVAQSPNSDDQVNPDAQLLMGASTTLNVDNLNVGQVGGVRSTLGFKAGTANPTLTIRGTAGGSSRANITIGQAWDVYTVPFSTIDLTTGITGTSTLDAMVDTLEVHYGTTGNNVGSSFLMGAGTLDALTIRLATAYSGSHNNTITGTLTVGGGTVKVDSLMFTNDIGGNGIPAGVLNLNSGSSLFARSVTAGNGGAKTFNWNDGTIRNYDGTTPLTIDAGITIALATTGTHAFNIDSGVSGSVASVLSNAAAATGTLQKTGQGILTLSAANTYTGNTTVSAGRLNLSGSLTSAVTANNGAQISGSGITTGVLNLNSGATIIGDATGASFRAATVNTSGAASVNILGADGAATAGTRTMGVVRYSSGTGPATADFNTANFRSASVANVGAAGGETQLTYTAAAKNWATTSGIWVAGAAGADIWSLSGGDNKYYDGDLTTFNGIGSGTVTVNTQVSPGNVTFNNSNLTVSGSGGITGPTALFKTANGTVTLTTANTYTGATTITGGTLQIGGSGTLGAGAYAGAVNITNSGVFQYSSSASQTLSGNVTGVGALLKDGSGTLLLTNAGTNYTGTTTVNNGVLELRDTTGFASDITVNAGGTLRTSDTSNRAISASVSLTLNGGTYAHNQNFYRTYAGMLSVASDSFITTNNSGGTTQTYFDGGATGAGNLTITNSGAAAQSGIVFRNAATGSPSLSGVVTVNGGVIGLGSNTSATTALRDAKLNLVGATLQMTANGISINLVNQTVGALSGDASSAVVTNNQLTVGGRGDSTTFAGIMSGTGSLVKAGGGTFTVSGANTYSGNTTVSGGTLKLGTAGTATNTPLGTAAAGTVVNAGGALDLNGFTLATAEALTLGGTGVSGSGALTNSSGTAATYSGLITLGSTSSIVANGSINLSNAGIITGSGFGLTLDGTAASSSVVGIIGTGTGGLTKQGSGTWTISGANTFSGNTLVSAGTLVLGNNLALQNSALDTSGAGTVTVTGFPTPTLGGLAGSTNLASVITGGYGNVTSLTLNPGTGSTQSYSGVIANGAADMTLVKTGAGTQMLSGANTYTGGTNITAGILGVTSIGTVAGSSSSLGAAGGMSIGSGTTAATLLYNGTGEVTDRALTFAGTTGGVTLDQSGTGLVKFTGAISNPGLASTDVRKTLTLQGSAAGSGEVAGVIADAAAGSLVTTSVTKAGNGTWTLSGTNTYTGITTVSAGTLVATNPQAFGDPATNAATQITLAGAGATLSLLNNGAGNNGTITYGGPTGSATGYNVTANSAGGAAFNVGNNGANTGNTIRLGALDSNQTLTFTNANGYNLAFGAVTSTTTPTFTNNMTGGTLTLASFTSSSGANPTLTFNGNSATATTTVAGVISGALKVTQNGAGTLLLQGNNTYTGVTTVSSGTLKLGAAGSGANTPLGTTGGNTIVSTGGVLDLNGFTLATAEALTLSGTGISGSGALTNSSATAVTYSGLITLGNATSIVASNGNINLSATGNITGLGFGLILDGTAPDSRLSGNLTTGTGGLTKQGTGTWTLFGTNTFTGDTLVSAGTLVLGNSLALQNSVLDTSGAGTLTITVSALTLGGLSGSTNLAAVIPGGYGNLTSLTLNLASGNIKTFSGAITNSTAGMTLTKTGVGTQILSGANTYSGNTTLTAGTLSVGASNNLGNTSSNLIFNGGTLQITGTTLNSIASLGHAVSFGTNTAVGLDIASSSNTFTFAQALTQGTGAFTKSGPGNVTLSGNNTYTGNTTINAGTLTLSGTNTSTNYSVAGGALTTTANERIADTATVNVTGGTFDLQGNTETIGQITTLTNGTITGSTGNKLILNGAANTTAATGANTISANLQLSGASPLIRTISLTNASDTLTISGNLSQGSGAAALTKSGVGTLTLSGTNSYAGKTTLSAGTLVLAKTASLYGGNMASWTAANVTAGSGALLAFNVGGSGEFAATDLNTLLGNISLASSSSTGLQAGAVIGFDTTNAGGNFTQGNALTNSTGASGGNISLTKLGAGTLVLDKTNTYSGVTTIKAGTLSVANIGNGGVAGNLGNASSAAANLVLGGGTLQYTGATASSDRNFTLTAATTSTIEIANSTLTLGVGAATSGALTKTGGGTLVLNGNNAYTGLTTVSAGTLALQSLTSFAGPINNNATVELNVSSAASFGSAVALSGSGTYIKKGSAVLTFGGTQAITATGQFQIQDGTLKNDFNAVNWSANKADIDISSEAILDLYADPIYLDALTGSGFVQNNYGNNFGSQSGSAASFEKLVLGTNDGNGNFSGVIRDNATNAALGAGAGKGGIDVQKLGNGTQILSGANTYTGVTTINAGTLSVTQLANSGSASGIGKASTAASLVINGGTLQFSGTTGNGSTDRLFTIGTNGATIDGSSADNTPLTFTSTGPLATAGSTDRTLTLNGNTSETTQNTLSAAIVNPGGGGKTSLVKDGDNTWVLSGGNTYTGDTVVKKGTLIVSGSISGSLVRVEGGTLAGFGQGVGKVFGDVAVGTVGGTAPGSTLDPSAGGGDRGGTQLNIYGNLSLYSDAVFHFTLDNDRGFADSVVVLANESTLIGGSVSLGGSTLSGLVLGSTPVTEGTAFAILGAANGFTGTFGNVGQGGTILVGSNAFTVDYNYAFEASTYIVLTAVPEPTSGVLLFGSAMLLGMQRLRRRRTGPSAALPGSR